MVEVRCRQCGEITRLPKDHGAVSIVCTRCRWRECYPAHRHIPKTLAHDAGTAFHAHEEHERIVTGLLGDLATLTSHAFERFCAGLLEQLGHTVVAADAVGAESHALELRDGNTVTYVACHRSRAGAPVGREEMETLAESMRHAGARRGIFVTTGSFSADCRKLAADAGIELIGADGLRHWLESVDPRELIERN